ncbi:thiamine kinase [Erwinia tracheiphila]|nr:thiamine kinase [Erwinia tracheiphila]UIA89771.1 thiamine kinase [Erwinia tracheiphila]UIA98072.1 thiamine kinase [Erwinia tracheiphila]
MNLSGLVMVSFSSESSLQRLIARQFPAANAAGSLISLPGLSGNTRKITLENTMLVARYQHPDAFIPGVDRRREYRILRKICHAELSPDVFGYADRWLLLGWQPGQPLSQNEFTQQLRAISACMVSLHRQRLSGYRLQMRKMLERYWQIIHPHRRHCGWLKALRRLQKQGEPEPLRLCLLHMDIHAGNVINDAGDLKLIDWEYAGDGDVALELASVIISNAFSAEQQWTLVSHYAGMQNINPDVLHRQIRRWQPWLRLLVACWYELRWQQSGETLFKQLAGQSWQRMRSE